MTIIMSSSTSGSGSSNSSFSSISKAPDHTMKAYGRVELQLHAFVTSAGLFPPSPLSSEQDVGCRGVAGEVGRGRWCGRPGRKNSRCGKANILNSKIQFFFCA
jgi:hypothetical protein